jgi:hypothetical protein
MEQRLAGGGKPLRELLIDVPHGHADSEKKALMAQDVTFLGTDSGGNHDAEVREITKVEY